MILRNGYFVEMKPCFLCMPLPMLFFILKPYKEPSRVMLAINDKYRPDGAVFLPPQGLLAVAMAQPVNIAGTALYNYTEGYIVNFI